MAVERSAVVLASLLLLTRDREAGIIEHHS